MDRPSASKGPQGWPQGSKKNRKNLEKSKKWDGFRTVWGRFWDGLGVILGRFGDIFGPILKIEKKWKFRIETSIKNPSKNP